MKCRFEVVAVPEWEPPFVTPDRYSKTDLPNGRALFVWVGDDDIETMDHIGQNLRSPEGFGKVFSHKVFNAFDGGFISQLICSSNNFTRS